MEKCENTPFLNVLADVEHIIKQKEYNNYGINGANYNGNETRARITHITTQFINHNKNDDRISKVDNFLIRTLEKTNEFMKDNRDIVVTSRDKGNNTVVMNIQDYKDKMIVLLDDDSTYYKVETDPTIEVQKEDNKMITELAKKGYIEIDEKKRLLMDTAIPPRIYGNPKVIRWIYHFDR